MRLCINIDHVATLRNARGGRLPDPVAAALAAEQAGADGIVCHLREDRRHIRDKDVFALRKAIVTKLDLEMAATPDIISVALRVKPHLVTLVPEKRRELTTEGGLDVVRLRRMLKQTIEKFHAHDIPVSLFVDPVKDQIETSAEIKADMVELHTGEYADATTEQKRNRHLRQIETMALHARNLQLTVNAGHGLDYINIHEIAKIGAIEEVSIGHAIIARAIDVGLDGAVREMVRLVSGER